MSQDHDDDAARAQTRDLLNEQMAAAVEVLQDLAVNGPTATARLRAQQALRRRSAGAGWPDTKDGSPAVDRGSRRQEVPGCRHSVPDGAAVPHGTPRDGDGLPVVPGAGQRPSWAERRAAGPGRHRREG